MQILTCLAAFLVSTALRNRRKLHLTVKILNVSLFFHLISLLFDVVYYSRYSRDGMADENLLLVSGTFDAMADTTMMLLLISLAKGWTVVRRKVIEKAHGLDIDVRR